MKNICLYLNENALSIFLHCSAIGCADPPIRPNTWARRDDDKLIVSCNATGHRWYLVCSENEWIGTVENCDEMGTGFGFNSLISK